MKVVFSKFHGAGNDFVLIDNREQKLTLNTEQIAFLCHRRFGIGADGLMFLEQSDQYDFEMKYYNADGREGTMCGNGGRCIIAFADLMNIKKNQFLFKAIDGLHNATILSKNNSLWQVKLQMTDVNNVEKNDTYYFLNTGSPHHVEFVENVQDIDVFTKGKSIRNNTYYGPKGGTNVNFVSFENDVIHVRTYERGVEDETLACGTGVTAVAIATALHLGSYQKEYRLHAQGGDLQVSFDQHENRYTNIWLTGPAAHVFSSEIVL